MVSVRHLPWSGGVKHGKNALGQSKSEPDADRSKARLWMDKPLPGYALAIDLTLLKPLRRW